MKPRLIALVCALTIVVGACKGQTELSLGEPVPTTTSTSSTTTTTTPGSAPNGCDAAGLIRAEPRPDRTVYEVVANLDLAANTITGTLKATFTPDKATDQVVFRLWPNAPIPAGKGAYEEIADTVIDGKPVTFRMANPTTAVLDSGPLTPNKPIAIVLRFTLRLPGPSDDRLSRQGNTIRLGAWMPLLAWEPGVAWMLDPPTTNNAEASLAVPADFDVQLNTPPGLTVIANGVDHGNGRWKARAVAEWAASIGSFKIAEAMAGDVPVTVAVDVVSSETPDQYLSRVVSAINALTARYGPYPYPAYRLAITHGLHGGIEFPGHVMQGPNSFGRSTPHEVAHQWFYGLVGNNQGRDPWLDEGLATWAEAQVDNSYPRFTTLRIPPGAFGHLGESMPYWDTHRGWYYRGVYVAGLQALAALQLSPSAVDCALARYVAANAYRVATPGDLMEQLRIISPRADLVMSRWGAQRLN